MGSSGQLSQDPLADQLFTGDSLGAGQGIEGFDLVGRQGHLNGSVAFENRFGHLAQLILEEG